MSQRIDDPAGVPTGANRREATRILGLCGSLRTEPYNRKLLEAAKELIPPATVLELCASLKRVPPFDQDDETNPGKAVLELRDAIARADALLIATPQYKSLASGPSQERAGLDLTPRGEQCATRKASRGDWRKSQPKGRGPRTGRGARSACYAGAHVFDGELPLVRAHEQFDTTGQLRSATCGLSRRTLLEQLIRTAKPTNRLAD